MVSPAAMMAAAATGHLTIDMLTPNHGLGSSLGGAGAFLHFLNR
jgi:hypothetical protein